MQKDPLSYEMLLEKTKETGLTFSSALAGAVLEEVVGRIGASEYSNNLWIRNGDILGIEQYKKKLRLNLEYDYVIQKLKKSDAEKTDDVLISELAEYLKADVFEESEEHGVIFQAQMKKYKRYMQMDLIGNVGDMQVPISIKIYLLRDEKLIPKKEKFSCMMYPDVSVNCYSYPADSLLAERFMEVITRLELIQNIGAYYDIYYLLERESVDGRKVKDYIEEQCIQMGIAKEKTRLDMVVGYRKYTYMKKKWKVYLRSIHCTEPDWETVIERFSKFFEPIWKAVMDDLIFFGDWMPELNRFL